MIRTMLIPALAATLFLPLPASGEGRGGGQDRAPRSADASGREPARGPLRVHPENPRYFADGSGRAVYLSGSHTWSNLVDMGPDDPPAPFDFEAYLAWLEAHGHNFIRLWTWELTTWDTSKNGPRHRKERVHHVAPHPWARTGPGEALDGKPRFDLEELDPRYFERLRARVAAAGKRGIYVSVMLFEGWGLQFAPGAWESHPFHPRNNVNDIDGDENGDGKGVEVHTLADPRVTAIQERYVRKVIDTVGDLDNVLWEISNENHPPSTRWQYHMIDLIHEVEKEKPKRHPVGMTFQYRGGENETLFASPAAWVSPNREGGYRDDPPAGEGRKVVISDTDHLWGIGGNEEWVWKTFLRGHHAIFMDPYDGSVLGDDRPEWEPVRRAMGRTIELARRVDLAAMTPRGDLASTGYCLADPGREYLVYLPGGGPVSVDLAGAPGPVALEWLETASGKRRRGAEVPGGGRVALEAPFAGSAVLHIEAKGRGSPGAPVPREPLFRTVDLDVGNRREVELADGSTVRVKLLGLEEKRDPIRNAVREATVDVEVDGERVRLVSANYRLPVTVAGVRIDCPITRGYTTNSRSEVWALERAARLRLWPAGSPLIAPETFVYPARQRWFASLTQMANEPTFVDAGEVPGTPRIYYHYGLDIGGAEGLVDIVAATSGLVVSSGTRRLAGHEDTPVNPRYDVVYLLDERGWYYRYSHLKEIGSRIVPGARIEIGEEIGVLGKEGGSGGWSHLHFDISSRQPNGKWGIQEGYGFLWEAYVREHEPELIAVARPHEVALTGEVVKLDGSRSWSAAGDELRFEWTFTDGSRAEGPVVERAYERPGEYSEVLTVTDERGRVARDFAVVQVFDRKEPRRLSTIHPAYSPTFGIRAGDPVTFKVRSFGWKGGETWDFGDGTPPVEVRSDGNEEVHAGDGYAVTTHRFEAPGSYVVRVEHTDAQGIPAIAHLDVRVGPKKDAKKGEEEASARVHPGKTRARKAPGEEVEDVVDARGRR